MNENAQKVVNLISEINRMQSTKWLSDTVFTWRWWVGVFFTVVPWVVWLIVRNRNSSNRLLFVGLFVMIFTSYLDFMGVQFGLWYYEYKVLPIIPAYIPWDFSLLPVTIMLFLQYKPNFNPYIKALCFGLLSSFAGEPFFIVIRLYTPISWKSIYSFPIYTLLYLICHYLSRKRNFAALS